MKKKPFFPLVRRLILSGFMISLGILSEFARTDAAGVSNGNQGQIKKIELKLSDERQKLKKIDSQEKALLGELAGLEQEVSKERGAIAELSKKLDREEADIGMLRRELAGLKRSSNDIEIKISGKLVGLYKHIRVGYIRTLAEIEDVTQFLRRIKYLRAIMEEDRMVLIRAARQAQEHRDEISMTEGKLADTINITNEKKARLISLREELEKKVLRLVKIHNERKFYETAVLELQTAAEGLKQTLISIERKDDHKINRLGRFEDFKGKLPYPFAGNISEDQKITGSARPGGSKGIVIEGAPGSDVKAIFPGIVAFSGTLKGYGDLVIINHGSRFFTVSAHLFHRNKIEGDAVEEGDVLGQIGGMGSSGGTKLYFEIRRAGKSLNPREWLKTQ